MAATAREVTAQSFASDVIERSRSVVVVVDFWAPWCAPCQVLAPVLETVIGASEGRAELAKVNIDEHPDLARRFDVQGIPAVKAFRDGAVISEFVGAQPQPIVAAWLGRLLPSDSQLTLERARDRARDGDAEGAIAALEARLAEAPGDGPVALELSRLLLAADRLDAARRALAAIPAGAPEADEADRDRALIDMLLEGRHRRQSGESAAVPDDAPTAARFAAAGMLWNDGRHAEAFERLLQIVSTDREFGDDGARNALLAGFARLGSDHPDVEPARRRLGMILFS